MRKYAKVKGYKIPKGQEGLMLGYDPNKFAPTNNQYPLNTTNAGTPQTTTAPDPTITNPNNKWANAGSYANVAGQVAGMASTLPYFDTPETDITKKPVYDRGFSKLQQKETLAGVSKGASIGATVGSIVPGVGTGIGAAVGAGAGAIGGFVGGTIKKNKQFKADEAAYADYQSQLKAEEEEKKKRAYEDQLAYTSAYNTANPTAGREGASIYAKGGILKYPGGGSLPQGFTPGFTHYLGKDEKPLTREQLMTMGNTYYNTEGELDQYETPQGYQYYKPVPYGSPNWSNPENPLNVNTTAVVPTNTNVPVTTTSATTTAYPAPKYPRVGTPEWNANQELIKQRRDHNYNMTPTVVRANGGSINKYPGGGVLPTTPPNPPNTDSIAVVNFLNNPANQGFMNNKYVLRKDDKGNEKVVIMDAKNKVIKEIDHRDYKKMSYDDRLPYKYGIDQTLISKKREPIYNLFQYTPTTVHADGGAFAIPYDKKALGGKLIPLASDATKAVGDTHEEDSNNDGANGITLQANGQPIAEIEDKEVIDGTRVFSDRRGYAKMVEPLLRKKGKLEKQSSSTNYREANSANRMLANIQSDIDGLFEHQEMTNPDNQPVNNGIPVGANGLNFAPTIPLNFNNDPNYLYRQNPYGANPYAKSLAPFNIEKDRFGNIVPVEGTSYETPEVKQPSTYDKVDYAKIANTLTPYLDNVYNEAIIRKTPKIPTPIKSKAYDLKPVTLKTNYNINPALNDAERAYQMLQKDLNENTANPATARGNKLYAFADLLNNKSRLYGNKENIETDLINKSNMNVQSVIDRNTGNRQGIDNANIGQDNTFNWNKMQRESDINKMRTANFANVINDRTKQIQDSNMESLDQQRITMDSLKYGDASGIAQTIGTPTMDNMVRSDKRYYEIAEKALKDAGQKAALQAFYKRYGSPNQ